MQTSTCLCICIFWLYICCFVCFCLSCVTATKVNISLPSPNRFFQNGWLIFSFLNKRKKKLCSETCFIVHQPKTQKKNEIVKLKMKRNWLCWTFFFFLHCAELNSKNEIHYFCTNYAWCVFFLSSVIQWFFKQFYELTFGYFTQVADWCHYLFSLAWGYTPTSVSKSQMSHWKQ